MALLTRWPSVSVAPAIAGAGFTTCAAIFAATAFPKSGESDWCGSAQPTRAKPATRTRRFIIENSPLANDMAIVTGQAAPGLREPRLGVLGATDEEELSVARRHEAVGRSGERPGSSRLHELRRDNDD